MYILILQKNPVYLFLILSKKTKKKKGFRATMFNAKLMSAKLFSLH